MAAGALLVRGLRLRHLPDHPEHQDGMNHPDYCPTVMLSTAQNSRGGLHCTSQLFDVNTPRDERPHHESTQPTR